MKKIDLSNIFLNSVFVKMKYGESAVKFYLVTF